eukprot:Gb_30496 [translate_table: standard]
MNSEGNNNDSVSVLRAWKKKEETIGTGASAREQFDLERRSRCRAMMTVLDPHDSMLVDCPLAHEVAILKIFLANMGGWRGISSQLVLYGLPAKGGLSQASKFLVLGIVVCFAFTCLRKFWDWLCVNLNDVVEGWWAVAQPGGVHLSVIFLRTIVEWQEYKVVFDSSEKRVRGVDLKHDFAFVVFILDGCICCFGWGNVLVCHFLMTFILRPPMNGFLESQEFSDPRDADEARYHLNGRDLDGSRIIVEFARRGPQGAGGSREYLGRGLPPGTGRCFNCGNDGHWARDCKAGDWKNKCYRCGERGHIERNCRNSPRSPRRHERSLSRSPSSPRPRGRGRSRSLSYSRSRSHSRSPRLQRNGRSGAQTERRQRNRSPSYSRSPRDSGSPQRGRGHSPQHRDRGSPVSLRRVSPGRSISPEGNGQRNATVRQDAASQSPNPVRYSDDISPSKKGSYPIRESPVASPSPA